MSFERKLCAICNTPISSNVADYSIKHYKKYLCFAHQKQKTSKPSTTSRMREGRAATPEEQALFDALIDEGFEKDEIILNKKADYKTVDMSIQSAMLNIEVDGLHHQTNPEQAIADIRRTYHSFKKGWFTIRVPNVLVRTHLRETAHLLKEIIEEGEDQLDD